MATFKQGAGVVVASDVRDAVAAFDGALLSSARMCVTVLEAAQGAEVPVAESQKVLRALSSGLSAVVEGRGEIVSAVRHLTTLKRSSNIAAEDYGCPDGWTGAASAAPMTGDVRSAVTA